MDSREAIEWLKSIRRTLIFEQVEAIDLAIEALKEPTKVVLEATNPETLWERGLKSFDGLEKVMENKGVTESATTTDCISRQQAIEALDRIGSVDTEADREYARDIFDNLPPVTPTERTGEWIRRKDGGATCSRCGVMLGKGQWTNYDGIPDYYCYKCGAKMGGDTE